MQPVGGCRVLMVRGSSMLAAALSFVCLTAAAADNTRTYLTLDHRNIIDSTNLELQLGTVHKHPANPILAEEKAWELRFDNFQPSVLSHRCCSFASAAAIGPLKCALLDTPPNTPYSFLPSFLLSHPLLRSGVGGPC